MMMKIMSLRLKRNFDLLRLLQQTKLKQRKLLLEGATNDLVLCICEIVDNILEDNVHMTPKQRKSLIKYKKVLRTLVNRKVAIRDKKELIANQKGGFLPAVLAPILSIAASLIADQLL